MNIKLTLLAAVALASGLAMAQPSEYYVWKHKTSGKTLCDVAAPDAHWTKVSGPYEDPACKLKMPQ